MSFKRLKRAFDRAREQTTKVFEPVVGRAGAEALTLGGAKSTRDSRGNILLSQEALASEQQKAADERDDARRRRKALSDQARGVLEPPVLGRKMLVPR